MKTVQRPRRSVTPRFGASESSEPNPLVLRPTLVRLLGVLISVLSMNLLVVQPLLRRQERLEREFSGLRVGMDPLRDSGETAVLLRQTAEVLEGIRRQHRAVVNARGTVDQLEQFHREFNLMLERMPDPRTALLEPKRIEESVPRSEQTSDDSAVAFDAPTEFLPAPEPIEETAWQMEIRPRGGASENLPAPANGVLQPMPAYARLADERASPR